MRGSCGVPEGNALCLSGRLFRSVQSCPMGKAAVLARDSPSASRYNGLRGWPETAAIEGEQGRGVTGIPTILKELGQLVRRLVSILHRRIKGAKWQHQAMFSLRTPVMSRACWNRQKSGCAHRRGRWLGQQSAKEGQRPQHAGGALHMRGPNLQAAARWFCGQQPTKRGAMSG